MAFIFLLVNSTASTSCWVPFEVFPGIYVVLMKYKYVNGIYTGRKNKTELKPF